MPKRNLLVLALLPVAILVIPAGTSLSHRAEMAAVCAATLLACALFLRWVRHRDARTAASAAARRAEGS